MVNASKEFPNCWALHNAACANVKNTNANWVAPSEKSAIAERLTKQLALKKASQRTVEVKRKATEAHEKMSSHRERSRRVTNEHTRSEVAVNNSMGWQVRKRYSASHSFCDLRSAGPREQGDTISQTSHRAHRGMATTTSRCTACECSDLRSCGGSVGREAAVICHAPFCSVLVFLWHVRKYWAGSLSTRNACRLDAERERCGVLTNDLCQWIDKCVR